MTVLRCGEQRFEPVVTVTGDGFEVSVGDEVYSFTVKEASPGVYVYRSASRTVRFHLAREGGTTYLFWQGAAYTLEDQPEGTRPPRRHEGDALEAPMPGRVAAVRAVPGQRVSRGEELLVVEAMKMENALRAPRNAVVRAVHVSTGDMVSPGRPLVELEDET